MVVHHRRVPRSLPRERMRSTTACQSVPPSFTAEFALAVVSGLHAAVTEQHHRSAWQPCRHSECSAMRASPVRCLCVTGLQALFQIPVCLLSNQWVTMFCQAPAERISAKQVLFPHSLRGLCLMDFFIGGWHLACQIAILRDMYTIKENPVFFFFLLNGWLNAIQSFAKEHILTKKPNTSLLEVEILLFGGGMSATVPLPKLCILPTPNTCISAKHSFETIWKKMEQKFGMSQFIWKIVMPWPLSYRLLP